MIDKNLTIHDKFKELSDYLLNQCVLNINGIKYRLTEIEFYYRDNNHMDEYTHKNDEQLEYEKIYFHKMQNGFTYKGGTFKGMDISLGDKINKKYYGVLIRSMYNAEKDEFIEGPCNCVNKLLELHNFINVKDFMNSRNEKLIDLCDANESVKLEACNLQKEIVYYGPRIGLSKDKYPEYRQKLYRCVIMKNRIKKEKSKLKQL